MLDEGQEEGEGEKIGKKGGKKRKILCRRSAHRCKEGDKGREGIPPVHPLMYGGGCIIDLLVVIAVTQTTKLFGQMGVV